MKRVLGKIWAITLLCGMTLVCNLGHAYAQTFTNTTVGDIGDGTRCGTANLARTVNVTGVGTVTDINFGLLATHSQRGDIRLDLTSPAPGSVTRRLIVSDTSNAGKDSNYNIELGDEAAELINTGSVDGAHNTAVAPYQFLARPNNSLSAFNGANANGNWTITMCDDKNKKNGQFLQASLTFPAPVTGADLSLSASTPTFSPEIGSTVAISFDVVNIGPQAAAGVTTQINLPAGLSYVGQTGSGTFNDATGLWTLPTPIGSSSTTTITISATVESTGPYNVTGEITASDKADPDSTPNNNSTTEDDDVSVSFSPVPSTTAPNLTCPVGDQFTLNWAAPGATNGWPAGTLTNSYTVGSEAISFAMTGNTNRFIARTFSGSTLQTPVTTTQFANGANAGNHGIVMNVDYTTTSENILTTIDLGTPATGVGQLQFQILDVDNGAWIDRLVITGALNGVSVTPTLTASGSNTVSGSDTFLGTGGAATGNAAGNTTVTFLSAVDVVTFRYDNASATTDPASQVISLQKLTMCPPQSADLTASKSVEVYDPGNVGLYMTPGNEVLYRITVNNSASATADAESIDLSDTLPDNVRFISATTTGFTGGAFGSPALPAANTDCAAGACVVRYSGATLPINTTGEIQVRALIK